MTSLWNRWWYGLCHRHRIELFSKVTIILEQSEWPIAKDAEPFSRRCNARHWQNVLRFGECLCLDIGKHLFFMGKNNSENLHSIKIDNGKTHCKTNVRDIWTVDIGIIRWDFWECPKAAGKVLHGNNYLWSMMKKSSVSCMQRFMYSQIMWYVLERWIRTQHQILFGNDSWIGSKIHHNTEHWTESTENRWNSSGIFSQDSPHCSSATKLKSYCWDWA